MKIQDLSVIALVILFGVLVQVVLAGVSLKDTPVRAAEAFTRAYFLLDPAMKERMCENLLGDANEVDELRYHAAQEARARGFSPNYMRMQLFDIKAEVLAQDAKSAQVELAFEMKRAIHPAFAYFAKLWNIGETYHAVEVLELVKEAQQWKVCKHDLALDI
jgi:hypothetical protein